MAFESRITFRYSASTPIAARKFMATITKTPSATWKTLIRETGWPTTVKTFRTKRDAEDWRGGRGTRWSAVLLSSELP